MDRKPLVVHIATSEDPLRLERQALAGVDCDIVSAAVHSEGEILEAIKEATVVLNYHSPVTRQMFEEMPNCRLMIRYGHGYDTVDVDAATDHGVMVTNIAGSTSEEVSNHALALLLACARSLKPMDRATSAGKWGQVYSRSAARRVWGETLGVIGFGHIGRAMARKGRALGMRVLVHDPYVGPWIAIEYDVTLVEKEELFREADYISAHVPLTPETHHIIGEKTLALMKPTSFVINTARGPVVDEAALTRALREGRIAGAGLDVFEEEPVDPDNPLLHMENVIVTPHIAGSSEPGWATICRRAGEEAARALRGERPQVLVNPEVLGRLRGD